MNSRGTNAVYLYDQNGLFLDDFIPSNSGGLVTPEDVLFHPDGSMLVTGSGNTAIKRYDGETGAYLGDFSSGYDLEIPSKMSLGWDSLIYVTQWGTTQQTVVRFSLDGQFVDEFTQVPAPNGIGHAWDAEHNFFLALYGNGTNGSVQKFDTAGNSLGTFVSTTYLQGPTDIWFDTNGDLLVEDWTTGKVLRYDTAGQYVGEFITGLTNPEGIATLPNGQMIIGDWGEDAVHLVDSSGAVLGYFASGNSLTDPNNITLRITEEPAAAAEPSAMERPTVYPNPASDCVFISSTSRDFEIELINALGERVLAESNASSLHLMHLPVGVYTLVLQDIATNLRHRFSLSIVR